MLVAIGGTAMSVVKNIAPDIPTVFSFGSDPVQAGFVKSIARPNSNFTGVTTRIGPEFQSKRLELFKEAVPILRRVAVLYNARGENPGHEMNLNMLRESAPKLDIKLIIKPIKGDFRYRHLPSNSFQRHHRWRCCCLCRWRTRNRCRSPRATRAAPAESPRCPST